MPKILRPADRSDPGLASVQRPEWPGEALQKGLPMSIKLTDAQMTMLSAAMQREDRCLVAPKHLKGVPAQKAAAKLTEAGLAKEVLAKAEMPIWRRDEEAARPMR